MEKELLCITIIVSLYLLLTGYFIIKGIIILASTLKNRRSPEIKQREHNKFYILPNKTFDDLTKEEAVGITLFLSLILFNLISR